MLGVLEVGEIFKGKGGPVESSISHHDGLSIACVLQMEITTSCQLHIKNLDSEMTFGVDTVDEFLKSWSCHYTTVVGSNILWVTV